MRHLKDKDARQFVLEHDYCVIHLDAPWDGNRLDIEKQLNEVQPSAGSDVGFGYIDIDESQETAKEMKVLNVPSVAYFRGGTLIAVVIGVGQDIAANINLVKNGQVPDTSNGLSRL